MPDDAGRTQDVHTALSTWRCPRDETVCVMHRPIRYVLRLCGWYIVSALTTAARGCGYIPAYEAPTSPVMRRPVWWTREAHRGVHELETFLDLSRKD